MKAEGAGKHSIAETNLTDIVFGRAAQSGNPCNALRPHVQIVLRISNHRRLPGCTGRSMNPYKFVLRYGKHAKRICIAHIAFGCKRQPAQIAKRLDICRFQPCLFHFCTVIRHFIINISYGFTQLLCLNFFNFCSGKSLFFCPNHFFCIPSYIQTCFIILQNRRKYFLLCLKNIISYFLPKFYPFWRKT